MSLRQSRMLPPRPRALTVLSCLGVASLMATLSLASGAALAQSPVAAPASPPQAAPVGAPDAASPGEASATDASPLARANQAFWKGEFRDATRAYRRLLRQNDKNADLWYNLGTAAARDARFGVAIHALEQALLLRPDHSDAEANLQALRAHAVTRAAGLVGAGRVILPGDDDTSTSLLTAIAPMTLSRVFALTWVLLFAALAIWRTRPAGNRRALLSIIALLLGLTSAASAALLVTRKLRVDPTPYAVVTAAHAKLRTGPGPQYPEGPQIMGGVKVRLKGADQAWQRVTLPDGQEGWLNQSQIRTLTPP